MSPTLSLRRRRVDADVDVAEPEAQPDDDLSPIADGAHQTSTHLAARLAGVGLMICLFVGPLGLAVALLALSSVSSIPPAASVTVTDRSNEQATVGEFAQYVVVTWLTSTQDHPDALLALVKDAQASTLPRSPFTVKDPSVARITQADGTWSVTVAATVTDVRQVTARRFFQVPVRLDAGAVSALTLPAAVSPPLVAPAASSDYSTQMDSTGPQGQTVTEFLGAYLTGAGDVGRYLTPGVSLTALTPAPYTSVRLDDLRGATTVPATTAPQDGQRLRVLATATAVVTDQQSSSVTYALTLTARAGRWEINAIDPAPAFTPKTPAATASGTTPPSTERGSASSGTTVPRTP